MFEKVIGWTSAHPVLTAALAVLVLGWLLVSLLRPSANRRRVEWLATTSMYVFLLGLFVNLLTRAIASDWLIGMIAFGMLTGIFSCGLLVSTVRTFAALSGRAATSKASATH